MTAANPAKAARLFNDAAPYLREVLETAPDHGSVGLVFYFYDGDLARVEKSGAVQIRHKDRDGGPRR